MRQNRTSVWKVKTIWISQELPLFNFELLDILCARIGYPCEKLWPFEFRESFRCLISSVSIYYKPKSDIRVKSYDHLNFSRTFVVQYQASRHIMCLNRTSVWKVMTIWISQELPLFNFERLDMWFAWKGHPCEKLYQLNFSRASVVQFRASRHTMCPNRISVWKVTTIWISREFPMFNFERIDIL